MDARELRRWAVQEVLRTSDPRDDFEERLKKIKQGVEYVEAAAESEGV